MCRDHFSHFMGAGEKKETNSLWDDKYSGKGKTIHKVYFPWEGKSGSIRWCSQMWTQAPQAMKSSLPKALCLVSMDHRIFVKLKSGCPSSLPVMSDDRLNSLDWNMNQGKTHVLPLNQSSELADVDLITHIKTIWDISSITRSSIQ